jgi:hypothetical protein
MQQKKHSSLNYCDPIIFHELIRWSNAILHTQFFHTLTINQTKAAYEDYHHRLFHFSDYCTAFCLTTYIIIRYLISYQNVKEIRISCLILALAFHERM